MHESGRASLRYRPGMLLNRLEKLAMNNPFRAAVQRHVEAIQLLSLGGLMRGGRALEVGCGRGVGAELILDLFGAGRVDAFDLDPDMVARARERLAPRGGAVRLWVGDVTAIASPDGAYDAVFDFGIIHHVPVWRDALREIHRVLRPGGRFYCEEVLARFLEHPVWRRMFEHPTADRFDRATFVRGLEEAGLQVVGSRELWGRFAWFVADRPA